MFRSGASTYIYICYFKLFYPCTNTTEHARAYSHTQTLARLHTDVRTHTHTHTLTHTLARTHMHAHL